jgi:hypothetical protein
MLLPIMSEIFCGLFFLPYSFLSVNDCLRLHKWVYI